MIALARRIGSWLLLGLCLGFIVIYFLRNGDALRMIANIGPLELAALGLLHAAYLLLHGYRYKLVLEKCSGRRIDFRPWFRIYVLGRFLNAAIPQLGNVYRGVQLKEMFQVTYTRYVSGFLSVAWISNCFNLLIAAIVLGSLAADLRIGSFRAWSLILGLTVLVGCMPSVGTTVLKLITLRHSWLVWFHGRLTEVLSVSLTTLRDRRYMTRLLVLSAVLLCQACVIFFVCFRALDIAIGPAELTLFFVLLQIATYINLTPGNFGVQEIAFGLLSEQMGIGMAEGLLVGALLRAAGYLSLFALALPLGGAGVLRRSLRLQRRGVA